MGARGQVALNPELRADVCVHPWSPGPPSSGELAGPPARVHHALLDNPVPGLFLTLHWSRISPWSALECEP